MYYVVFLFSKRKNKKVEDENLLSFPMLFKNPSLCIHSFTGWLKAFSFILPIKENIKTNYSLSSLSWNGCRLWTSSVHGLGMLSHGSRAHPPATCQGDGRGDGIRRGQSRTGHGKSLACTLANSMHLETLSLPFLSCVFLRIEWAMITYFLILFFSSVEDPIFS